MTATSISTPTVSRATHRAAKRGLDRVGVPGWLQAMPFGLVFAFFFIIPLILVVVVSFWDYNDY
jgi:putative spermidine/putrescine transport system permease protein